MCLSNVLHDPVLSFFRMIEVISDPEACSWKHYAGLLIHVCPQKLDNVLKELHGSHYIFILLRKENRRCCCGGTKLHELGQSPCGKTCHFDVGFTFWQVSMNSSIVTTPSLFRSIFWKMSDVKDAVIFGCHWLGIFGSEVTEITYLKESLHVFVRWVFSYAG